MLGAHLERIDEFLVFFIRLVDRFQNDRFTLLLQILDEQHCVIAFFLGLDHVPVRISIKAGVLVVV